MCHTTFIYDTSLAPSVTHTATPLLPDARPRWGGVNNVMGQVLAGSSGGVLMGGTKPSAT